jgi:hypothetical protein
MVAMDDETVFGDRDCHPKLQIGIITTTMVIFLKFALQNLYNTSRAINIHQLYQQITLN